MQISLTHAQPRTACCAAIIGLWSLHAVSSSFGHFLLVSCSLWGQLVGRHLICAHSMSMHHNRSQIRFITQMHVGLFSHTDCFKSSVHSLTILSHSSSHANVHHIHSCSFVASCGSCVYYIILSVPPPPRNHVETFWMPKSTKHDIWTGKSGSIAFQGRGRRQVTVCL